MAEFKGTKGIWVMKHSETKSSWKVLGTTFGERYNIARCDYIYDPNLDVNWNKLQLEEQKANALLISKAPEMLDMLKSVLATEHLKGTIEESKIKRLIKETTEL